MSSEVFFSPLPHKSGLDRIIRALKNLLNAVDFDSFIPENGFVGVKTHFGEKGNKTHIPPGFFKPIAARIKQCGGLSFFTETSTLYKGKRTDSVRHLLHAHEHGFTPEATGMPIIMADGIKGEYEVRVPIDKEMYSQVNIAGHVNRMDALVCCSHPTGHIAIGFGGAIKNLGMGLSGRKGKLVQHSAIKPYIVNDKCTQCGNCIRWCPEEAISINSDNITEINEKICAGCGECLVECSRDAVKFNWAQDQVEMQKMVAEHALGVCKSTDIIYINYLMNFTKDCDCMGYSQKRLCEDIGIVISYDPVAIDQASIDIIQKHAQCTLQDLTGSLIDQNVQLTHGEKIGIGSRKYTLTTIDKKIN
jgi:uncharacterized Fe-S center protein